ncbi:hypothetical protein F5Y15DRAFT_102773 [Xylariaceae sp. FL0016]|nr:hypothetical protein F5Y15DRAFT_102773 [Xylariaceae sp. FL0016]
MRPFSCFCTSLPLSGLSSNECAYAVGCSLAEDLGLLGGDDLSAGCSPSQLYTSPFTISAQSTSGVCPSVGCITIFDRPHNPPRGPSNFPMYGFIFWTPPSPLDHAGLSRRGLGLDRSRGNVPFVRSRWPSWCRGSWGRSYSALYLQLLRCIRKVFGRQGSTPPRSPCHSIPSPAFGGPWAASRIMTSKIIIPCLPRRST